MVRLLDGGSVEAGMVGCVTVFGAAVALDGGTVLSEAVVQQAGFAAGVGASRRTRGTPCRRPELILAVADLKIYGDAV